MCAVPVQCSLDTMLLDTILYAVQSSFQFIVGQVKVHFQRIYVDACCCVCVLATLSTADDILHICGSYGIPYV